MKLPLQITYRDIESSAALSEHVHKHAQKLDTFCDRIISCRVAIEATNRNSQSNAKQFRVRLDVKVPHKELVAVHTPDPEDASGANLYLAIDTAFQKMIREVEDFNRVSKYAVKRHEGAPHGRVTKLFVDRGYGFLEDADGREIYFHENSVLRHRFRMLVVGSEVRFAEELGEKGPQASTVDLVGHVRRTVAHEEVDRPSYV